MCEQCSDFGRITEIEQAGEGRIVEIPRAIHRIRPDGPTDGGPPNPPPAPPHHKHREPPPIPPFPFWPPAPPPAPPGEPPPAPSVRKQWNTEPGACPLCMGNEAVGPIPEDEPFPSGDMDTPAHDKCRCYKTLIII